MAATKSWTIEELDRLPEDGNTYELVHGALFVTPAPTPRHEDVIDRLAATLRPYVAANALGRVYLARSAVRHGGSETEPDLMVRAQLDPDKRCICVVKPGHADVVCGSMLEWHPSGAREPLVVDVQSLFR